MKYLSIKELSKLTNVSIDTIKHYDRIDLFKPHHVGEDNGYRYYEVSQCYQLILIRTLRDLNMTTAEIKDHLNSHSLNQTITFLEMKLTATLDEIEKLKTEKAFLQSKLDSLRLNSTLTEHMEQLTIRRIKRRNAFSFGRVLKDKEDGYFYAMDFQKTLQLDSVMYLCMEHGILIPHEKIDTDTLQNVCIPFVLKPLDDNLHSYSEHTFVLQEGYYLCGNFNGILYDSLPNLKKMLAYAEAESLEIIGAPLMISRISDYTSSIKKEFLYEIQIPIKY